MTFSWSRSGHCPQNVCKLQSFCICDEIKNQIKNNEVYNGTKIGNYFRNASSEVGFNELMHVFRDGVSKQERL